MTQTAIKQADIRYRVELKNKPWIVVYKVRSSDDSTDYQVTVVNGRVSSCDCPAHGYGHNNCYIKRDVQAHEDARKLETAQMAADRKHIEELAEDGDPFFAPRLCRDTYCDEFGIYSE